MDAKFLLQPPCQINASYATQGCVLLWVANQGLGRRLRQVRAPGERPRLPHGRAQLVLLLHGGPQGCDPPREQITSRVLLGVERGRFGRCVPAEKCSHGAEDGLGSFQDEKSWRSKKAEVGGNGDLG